MELMVRTRPCRKGQTIRWRFIHGGLDFILNINHYKTFSSAHALCLLPTPPTIHPSRSSKNTKFGLQSIDLLLNKKSVQGAFEQHKFPGFRSRWGEWIPNSAASLDAQLSSLTGQRSRHQDSEFSSPTPPPLGFLLFCLLVLTAYHPTHTLSWTWWPHEAKDFCGAVSCPHAWSLR